METDTNEYTECEEYGHLWYASSTSNRIVCSVCGAEYEDEENYQMYLADEGKNKYVR